MSDATIGRTDCEPAGRLTRSLLGYGVIAGPLYLAVAIAQGLLRPGFDLLHDDVSLLANGDWGWVQTLNFVLTGTCVIVFSAGLARAIGGWAPRLTAVYGLGLVGAGIFSADPMNGFPAGAPIRPETVSFHGILHIVFAGVGFICLVAACIVIARRFGRERRRGWMAFSLVTGIAFLAAFAGVASGSGSAVVVLAFWAALVLAWSWMAAVAIDTYRRV